VLAAWERSANADEWIAWSRSDEAAELMGKLEAALETFAPPEGAS
jgi:hypothetical protein